MDETDRDIIESLLDREQSIHELAKTLFKTTDRQVLRKRYTFLRYRIGRLAEDGLIRKRKDTGRTTRRGESVGRAVYYVPLEDMIYGKARLLVDNGTANIIELELGKVLVTEKDGEQRVLLLQR